MYCVHKKIVSLESPVLSLGSKMCRMCSVENGEWGVYEHENEILIMDVTFWGEDSAWFCCVLGSWFFEDKWDRMKQL